MNKNDNTIKKIIFNKNPSIYSNENNENNKTIVFNKNNNETIYFGENENNNISENILSFVKKEDVIIEKELTYIDEKTIQDRYIPYIKEMEEQLLSEFPVTKQGLLSIQHKVQKNAIKIIENYNIAEQKKQLLDNNIEYNTVFDALQNNYDPKFIIPITTDKHIIYSRLSESDTSIENSTKEEDDKKEQNNIYFVDTFESDNQIIIINQKEQHQKLWEIEHKKSLNEITYIEYLNNINEVTKRYVPYNFENYSIKKKPLCDSIQKKKIHDSIILNYYNYDTIHWNYYKYDRNFVSNKNVYEEGKITTVDDLHLTRDDDINIVGLLFPSPYSEFPTTKFSEIAMIRDIISTADYSIIECQDKHNLKNENILYVYIDNSIPVINKIFINSFTILDSKKIRINKKLNITKGGTGKLYTLTKFPYDMYQIEKVNEKFVYTLSNSTYESSELNNNHNKIYLFDKNRINNKEFSEIIKNLFPTKDKIIDYLKNRLDYCSSFNDVNDILKIYNLDINQLEINQINIIKTILNKNLQKMLDNIEIYTKKEIENIHSMNNIPFLSDMFINHKNIISVYGNYPHYKKNYDNNRLRYKWIDSQKDDGLYYYLNYILYTYKSFDISFINKKIKDLSVVLKTLQKNDQYSSASLYQYQAILIKNKSECKELKLSDGNYVFMDNNLYVIINEKPVEVKNSKKGSIALINNELWNYQDNKWSKTTSFPKYEKIKYLCELKNLDLKTTKLDTFDTIYRQDTGCMSKTSFRMQEKIKELENQIQNLNDIQYYYEKDKNTKILKEKMENIKKKYFENSKYDSRIKNEITLNKIKINQSDIPKDKMSTLLSAISKINDFSKKMEYIFTILDKDGFIINNQVYSKKYKKPFNSNIICIHHTHLKKIEYSTSILEKQQLYNQLIELYSDGGESEKNNHTCKICGQFLISNDYDDTEGFDASGKIKKSREILSTEMDNNTDISDYLMDVDISDLTTVTKLLLDKGVSMNNIEDAKNIILFIDKNLCAQTGIKLSNNQVIMIAIDSIQKINKIITFKVYEKLKKMKIEKKSMKVDEYAEKGLFEKEYTIYREMKKNSIIISRFLISVQTSIPSIHIHNQISMCPFYSFDNEEGIIYMACVADKLKLVEFKNKTVVFDRFKEDIQKEYNEFLKLIYIKDLFEKKKKYTQSMSKKKVSQLNKQVDDISRSLNIEEPPTIQFNYKKTKENEILYRHYYLSNQIKKIVSDVIQKANITNTYTQSVELSCCTEIATDFIDFYEEIKARSEYVIQKDIDETYVLFDMLSYYIHYGSIHKVIMYDKNIFTGINNDAIVDDEKNTSSELIKSVFEIYVNEGYHIGTQREYVNDIDIKTGRKKSEILNRKYTMDDYQKLLRNIEKNNIKIPSPPRDIVFNERSLDELKKLSNEQLKNQIKILMNNICISLGKDNKFKDKYTYLFENFGNFYKKDIVSMNDIKTDRKTDRKTEIKYENELNNFKLNYIKTFYVDKLKKYISMIQNYEGNSYDDLEEKLSKIIDDELVLGEIQKEIFNKNQKLLPFFEKNTKSFFNTLEVTYTNKQIDNIRGIDHVYDKDYKKIKKFSNFTSNDAYNSMLYIFVKQLNDFILCDIETDKIVLNNEDLKNKKKYSISNKCTTICRFITVLFEELENDSEYNSCTTEQIDNMRIRDVVNYKINIFTKKDKIDFLSSIIQSKLDGKTSTKVGELDEQQDITNAEVMAEQNDIDKRDEIRAKLSQKLGRNVSNDEVTSFKNKYNERMNELEEYNIYNFDEQAKGADVLDKGHYGDEDVHDNEEFFYTNEMDS